MLYLSGTETKYGQTLFGEPQQRKHPDKGPFAWWNYRQNLWYLKISREIKLTSEPLENNANSEIHFH